MTDISIVPQTIIISYPFLKLFSAAILPVRSSRVSCHLRMLNDGRPIYARPHEAGAFFYAVTALIVAGKKTWDHLTLSRASVSPFASLA